MNALRVLNHGTWRELTPVLVLARSGGAFEAKLKPGIEKRHLLPRWVRSSTLSMFLSVIPLAMHLRRNRPAVLISFLSHTTVVAWLALRLSGYRGAFVVGHQNNPDRDLACEGGVMRRGYLWMLRKAFQRADYFVGLSQGVSARFSELFPEKAARVHTIYNAGFEPEIERMAKEQDSVPERPEGRRLIVACGRLTEQKNYPLLLEAFAKLSENVVAELWILGQGALRSGLEQRCGELGIRERVRFLGFQKNPYPYMTKADAFVLSSDWEGFGNVIVEAMAVGVPVIATACPYGPAEIIESGKNGVLVPVGDVERLSGAMAHVLKDPVFERMLRVQARERAKAFSAVEVARSYETFFARILHHG